MNPTVVVHNPLRREVPVEPPPEAVAEFHRRLPGYRPTQLLELPALADRLGVGRLLVKAETERLGLRSFKILGASWATYRAVVDHTGVDPEPWADLGELAERLAPHRPMTLAAATDGNHGLAVAHVAALLGFGARIFVPAGTARARMDSIRAEGASVTVVDGGYDDAVRLSAEEAGDRCLVVSDTSWPGYETTPMRVIEGYATICAEVDEQLGGARPDAVVVPVGVGALAAAVVTHYGTAGDRRPLLIGVEPADAASVLASATAGRLVTLEGEQRSIMVGLNCATPSMTAWPVVSAGLDWLVAMDDEWARRAMRDLAEAGVDAGETGAAALAAVEAVVGRPDAADLRPAMALGPGDTVLLLCTEGPTDPAAFEQIVGRSPR